MTPRRRVRIQRALGRHHRLEVAETSSRGHATRLARGAARDGIDVVVVAGGDGTLNEAADGLAGTETALAPLPGGSTNVFARTRRDAQPTRSRPSTSCWRASSASRSSASASAAATAATSSSTSAPGTTPRSSSRSSTIRGSSVAWRIPRSPSPPSPPTSAASTGITRMYQVEVDGAAVGDGFFAIVSNTAPYAFFGPRRADGDAAPPDSAITSRSRCSAGSTWVSSFRR